MLNASYGFYEIRIQHTALGPKPRGTCTHHLVPGLTETRTPWIFSYFLLMLDALDHSTQTLLNMKKKVDLRWRPTSIIPTGYV